MILLTNRAMQIFGILRQSRTPYSKKIMVIYHVRELCIYYQIRQHNLHVHTGCSALPLACPIYNVNHYLNIYIYIYLPVIMYFSMTYIYVYVTVHILTQLQSWCEIYVSVTLSKCLKCSTRQNSYYSSV